MFSAQYSPRTTDYKADTTDGCLGRIFKSGFGGDLGLTVVLETSMPVMRAAERMVWAATMALVVTKVRVGIVRLGAAQRRRRGGDVRCWVCGLSFRKRGK